MQKANAFKRNQSQKRRSVSCVSESQNQLMKFLQNLPKYTAAALKLAGILAAIVAAVRAFHETMEHHYGTEKKEETVNG
jgi:hypothetical protein